MTHNLHKFTGTPTYYSDELVYISVKYWQTCIRITMGFNLSMIFQQIHKYGYKNFEQCRHIEISIMKIHTYLSLIEKLTLFSWSDTYALCICLHIIEILICIVVLVSDHNQKFNTVGYYFSIRMHSYAYVRISTF